MRANAIIHIGLGLSYITAMNMTPACDANCVIVSMNQPGLNGIRLGSSAAQIENSFGKPSRRNDNLDNEEGFGLQYDSLGLQVGIEKGYFSDFSISTVADGKWNSSLVTDPDLHLPASAEEIREILGPPNRIMKTQGDVERLIYSNGKYCVSIAVYKGSNLLTISGIECSKLP